MNKEIHAEIYAVWADDANPKYRGWCAQGGMYTDDLNGAVVYKNRKSAERTAVRHRHWREKATVVRLDMRVVGPVDE